MELKTKAGYAIEPKEDKNGARICIVEDGLDIGITPYKEDIIEAMNTFIYEESKSMIFDNIEEKIIVVKCEKGVKPYMANIPNTLKSLNKEVGGKIVIHNIPKVKDYLIIRKRFVDRKDIDANDKTVLDEPIYSTFLIAKNKGENLVSITNKDFKKIEKLIHSVKKNNKEEA